MPVAKEFKIRMKDRPGTLGKLCQALADQKVNILAFQSYPLLKGTSCVHLVVDDPGRVKAILKRERANYRENDVVLVKLVHRPGELARAASRLGEARVNINHGYCGVDAVDNTAFLIFGVKKAGEAARIVDQGGAAAATA